MIILVDQDQVLADFDGGWAQRWRAAHPQAPFVPTEERTTFYISDSYPPQWRPQIDAIRNTPTFFATLPPIPGAVAGINALRDAGHDVFICTSPLTEYTHCVLEKHQWVEQRLGHDWVRRIILTKDKTLVRGDILIDDKPHVNGIMTPTWTHVRYTQRYNEHLPGPRLTWDNALEVVADLEAGREPAGHAAAGCR